MSKLLPILLIFCLFDICFTSYTLEPRQYDLDLDKIPEERWTDILKDASSRAGIKEALTTTINMTVDIIPKPFRIPILKIVREIVNYLPEEYVAEMKGIAKSLNVSIEDICFINILYDYTAFCTSIVAQDTQGNIWHGRNLDYLFSDQLKKLTVVINFKRNGKIIYTGTSYLGLVGLITGQKPKVFTISLDERDKGNILLNLLVASLDKKSKHNFFLIREVLENARSYEDAVEWIQNTQTIAPAYFILGGTLPGQGAVITHGRLTAIDTWALAPENKRWFLVQTNYDHWEEPPKSDDRRHPAIRGMQKVGQDGINLKTMYNVLSTPPVLNKDTTYTTLMSAAFPDLYNTTIRHFPPRNISFLHNKPDHL